MIRNQKGQSLLLYGLLLVGLIAFMGLAIDGGMLVYLTLHARGAVSNACIYAADIQFNGGSTASAFYQSLAANNIPTSGYQPTSGSGTGLIRGITIESTSIRTAVRYQAPTYFMQIVGIKTMTISAHARCSTTGIKVEPFVICDKDTANSYNNGGTPKQIPLLGVNVGKKGHTDDSCVNSNKKFNGAAFPFIWCVNSANDLTPNASCPYRYDFNPPPPPSSQSDKSALGTCWNGYGCSHILSPVGTDIPILDGVSAKLTVGETGLKAGDIFLAMVFSPPVNSPSSGNWDNVTIVGWALYQVDSTKSNDLEGHALTPLITNINSLFYQNKTLLYPEEIPWNATTGW